MTAEDAGDAGAGAAEIPALTAALGGLRRHVLGILDGLDEEAMRRPVLPSGWSCLQLLHHLAVDDERFWFRGVVAGEPEVTGAVTSEPDEAGWRLPPDATGESVRALYRAEAARTDAIVAAAPGPDTPPAWWPEALFGDYRLHTLREILLHHITETATHAGHLDAARELIDGRQWLIAT